MSWEIPAFADYSSNFLCILTIEPIEGSQANRLSVKNNHFIFQLTLEKHSLIAIQVMTVMRLIPVLMT